jgi:2-hydroxy-6-oxonona-2,4-dienedioate hydrolase
MHHAAGERRRGKCPGWAVIAHDVEAQLGRIRAPTQITFGGADLVTSTRFADRMHGSIRDSELLIFDGCAHAPLYEKVEEFNQQTLRFLRRHARAGTAGSL